MTVIDKFFEETFDPSPAHTGTWHRLNYQDVANELATHLEAVGKVRTAIGPGNGTRYELTIVALDDAPVSYWGESINDDPGYLVAITNLEGGAYTFHRGFTHPDYIAEKLATTPSSSLVLAALLNSLWEALA